MTRYLYNDEYYLEGCEGFNYTVDNLSPRLQSVYDASLPYLTGKIIDVGCGRGELTIRAARLDSVKQVHAIDYSPHAIKLALQNLAKEPDTITDKISLHCDTISKFLSYTTTEQYNCAILADIVEHIPFEDAKKLIESIKSNAIIITTPISNAQPNERHLWLAKSENDIQNLAPDFNVFNYGYAGSGEDYTFILTRR